MWGCSALKGHPRDCCLTFLIPSLLPAPQVSISEPIRDGGSFPFLLARSRVLLGQCPYRVPPRVPCRGDGNGAGRERGVRFLLSLWPTQCFCWMLATCSRADWPPRKISTIFILSRRGGDAERQRKGWGSCCLWTHSWGQNTKGFFPPFCFVFSDSGFSEEGSLPGTASPALGTWT